LVGNNHGVASVISGLNSDNEPASARLDLRIKRGHHGGMTPQSPTPFVPRSQLEDQVSFDRRELGAILGVYGRMVAMGEWRDYGISCLKELAVFSVFRRTAEFPLYRIEKRPKLRARQGMYAVVGMDGQVLRRGHDLGAVLRVLESRLIRSVDPG
jgi:hypothetical protein